MKYFYNGFLEDNLRKLKNCRELVVTSIDNIKQVNGYIKGLDMITPATSAEDRLRKLLKAIDDEIQNLKEMIRESKR